MSDERPLLSHRATTSSRHPGRVFEGTVKATTRRALCLKCGCWWRWWRGGMGPHSPMWSTRPDGTKVIVDCSGDEVPRG